MIEGARRKASRDWDLDAPLTANEEQLLHQLHGIPANGMLMNALKPPNFPSVNEQSS